MRAIRKQTSILDLAGIVSTALERAKITAVLSGGAAVSIYTDNRYKSMDLDFVSSAETAVIEAALAPLGFERQEGSRYFTHDDTDFVLDFRQDHLRWAIDWFWNGLNWKQVRA